MTLSVPAILVSLLPVAVFLATLVYLDSYRLVRLWSVVGSIAAGCCAALLALAVNTTGLDDLGLSLGAYSRFVAPFVEELLKALYFFVLLFRRRVGFAVDAAIFGFAIGTGFALVENVMYLRDLPTDNMLVWVIRGFGTALMHGGTTSMLGVIARELQERRRPPVVSALGGLALAVLIHALYNQFVFSPEVSALLTLAGIPVVMVIVYRYSERRTSDWLGVGFDTDRELLEMITSGVLAENRVGQYLTSLERAFPPAVVADMLCYLRLYVELAIKAKGILLMREAGLAVPPDPEAREQFAELAYLGRSIGRTGVLALQPFVHTRSNDLWQLHLVKQE